MAEEFTGQARQLAELVAFFKLRAEEERTAQKTLAAPEASRAASSRPASPRPQAAAQPRRLAASEAPAPAKEPEAQVKHARAIVPQKAGDEDFEEF